MKTDKFYDHLYYLLLLKNLQTNSQTGGILGCGGCLVILIILIIVAVALPCYDFHPYKNKQIEGKNVVGTLMRSQQAYHFEEGTFLGNLTETQLQTENDLGVIIPESKYYHFSMETKPTVAYVLAIPKNAQKDGIKSYSSAIFFNEEEQSYQQIVCETDDIAETIPKPILENDILTCPENTTKHY